MEASGQGIRISTAGVAKRGQTYFVARRIAGSSIGESWEFPGGKNRREESPEQTLEREYREELGISIEVGSQICTGRFSNHGKEYELQAYWIEIPEDQEQSILLTEHQQISWKTLEELESVPMAESDRLIVRALKRAL